MEELIEKMKDEGEDVSIGRKSEEPQASPPIRVHLSRQTSEDVRTMGSQGPEVNRFIASSFWTRLTLEVEGLRQTMDDVSDEEETSQDPSSSSPSTHTPHSSVLFGGTPPASDIRLLHPSPAHMSMLCEIYAKQFDPMYKVLHIPSLRGLVSHVSANVQEMPSGNYVEALLFAVYYGAITTLTPQQCMQYFQDEKVSLLARYRTGVEGALANADFLNTTEMEVVQALSIFVAAVRANDDSQFSWSMVSVAIRLGTALGVHRENSRPGLTPFITEMRRRLWWELVSLDIRGVEERGSDPIIIPLTFNTKLPLNINDEDISPDSTALPPPRDEFTQITKALASSIIWIYAMRVGWIRPIQEGEMSVPGSSFAEREKAIDELVVELRNRIFKLCDPSNPLAWSTSVVMRLILCRLRLVLYHPPLHDSSSAQSDHVSGDTVLKVATELNEYSHLLDTEPTAAPYRWFFATYVQWHALAAALAELCVRDKGPLVERAWRIVDQVFPSVAMRIADSKHGMLWRPIKKLMSKAQAKRNESLSMSIRLMPHPQQQQPLPQFGSSSFPPTQPMDATGPWSTQNTMMDMATLDTSKPPFDWDQGPSSDALASLNVNESMDAINWAEWDEFMQDFATEDQPGAVDPATVQVPSNQSYTWW